MLFLTALLTTTFGPRSSFIFFSSSDFDMKALPCPLYCLFLVNGIDLTLLQTFWTFLSE